MKKSFLLLLSSLLMVALLSGCNEEEPIVIPADSIDLEEPVIENPDTQEPVIEEPDSDEQPEGTVRSSLTNTFVTEEVANRRPIAVSIPNDKNAIPHYNISKASVLYECMVEYNITRFMAVFEEWDDLERLGNVRSGRDYYVYWAFEWDAFYCHYGNPWYANDVLARDTTDNINGQVTPEGVFYRSTDRSAPHNAYLSSEGIKKAIAYYGYSLEHTSNYEEGHFTFAEDTSQPSDLSTSSDVIDCTRVDMASCYPTDKPYFEYNEDEDVYYRYQYGDAHIDEATGTQLSFANIIIQNTYYIKRDENGYLAFQCIDDTRDGYFITGGKAIPITWEKSSDYGPTKYYDGDGNEIDLSTGKTMICIVQDGKTFTLE